MKQKKKKETKDAEGFIEIPFGAFDSETIGWTYTIPEGFIAKIENGKIIVEKKESEDERIIDALTKRIQDMYDNETAIYEGVQVSDILAWLEKQKEQKPTVNIDNFKSFMMQYLQDAANRKTDSEIEADTDKWAKKLLNLIEVKEQKPAEIDEYKIIKKHITEDSLSSEVNKRLKECGWYVTDDRPVEWSEEDEKIIESLLRHFRRKYKTKPYWNGIAVKDIIAYLEKQKAKDNYDRMAPIYENKESFESALDKAWKFYNESGSSTVDGCEDNSMELSFAKGFREGVLYEKQKCVVEIENAYKNADKIQYEKGFEDGTASVKPVEWSEEDKEMVSFWNMYYEHKVGDWSNKDVVEHLERFSEWLNTRFKSLRPQPSKCHYEDE